MGFDFTGFVLRAPRTAPSNAITTDEASNGVDRDFKPLSDEYGIASPDLVEISADQYRSSVLLRTTDGQTEYLIWAANTANLADVGGFETSDGDATFPRGTTPVVNTDTTFAGTTGSNRVIIIDDASRTIENITNLVVRRGDTGDEFQLVGNGTWNPVTSIFTITDETTLLGLGGGVSSIRGDRETTLKYTLLAPAYWWSKNDRYENRFIWDGTVQSWVPIKGTPPRNLGVLLADTEYVLSPAPNLVPVGDFLPGNSDEPDTFCMVRLGRTPNASSLPVAPPVSVTTGFGGIQVLTDAELEDFDFSADPTLAGVVGQATGTLLWNSAFVEEFAGQTIFYSYAAFTDQAEIEPLGDLEDANLNLLFIAPIPGPTDYPFIRIGARQPLIAKVVDTEALLALLSLEEGEVGISLSTGRLKFSDADLAKADPDDPGFDNAYLGAQVFYDGVSMTRRPVPLRQPIRLVNSSGNPTTVGDKNHSIYIPDAVTSPAPGISGVIHRPDTTGTIPNTSVPAGIRIGEGSGLIREIAGPWDLVLFTDNGQIKTISTFDDDDEIPRFRFRIPRGTAFVDKRLGSGGSEVILGRQDLKRFEGKEMFFLQAGIQPSVFADEARMFSRVRNEFELVGTEVFVFAINGNEVTWDASADPGGVATSAGGTFTAEEIATSLNAVASGGSVVALAGRVILQTNTVSNLVHYGTIEIGYGPGGTKDLSGPSALGFLPGWIINIVSPDEDDPSDLRWLPDNGTHLGVFRSPFNRNGQSDSIPDSKNLARFDDTALTNSISDSPVVLLDRPPLEDVAGYDENIFFRIQSGIVSLDLHNYEEVFYEFGLEQFSWADEFRQNETVEQPTNNLFLGQGAVIANSFRLSGKGLRLSVAGQPFEDQELNTDFLLPDGGDSGFAILVEAVGPLKQLGGRGFFTKETTTFTDNSTDIDFVELGVKAGWQLKITQGDAEGTYVVAADATLTNSLEVQQQFPVSDSVVPWELFEGKTREEVDLGIVADTQYVQFEHLPEEPFKVRVLSALGDVPGSVADQEDTRLVAVLGDALLSGRPISIRYGLESDSEVAGMFALQEVDLGEIVNSKLLVPDVGSERWDNDDFSIRVGNKTYTFAAGDLIKVGGVLTFPLLGDVIEIQEVSGLLNFGADVFAQFDGQEAIYVEEFLTPFFLGVGEVEYRPSDGELNFSEDAIGRFGGDEVYLVEQMTTQGGIDVTLNPIQGSFVFTKPLREFQVVEADYFRAINGTGGLLEVPIDPDDPEAGSEPVHVIEQLPLFVRLDPVEATEPGATSLWRFNPTNRTVDDEVPIQLYVGSTQYNIGSSPTAAFEIDNDEEIYIASLEQPVDSTSQVQATYAVFEAFGGEQTYTVSQPPVFRPPFKIEADKTTFELESDRTGDVTPGKFLRVAEFPFYITESVFDATTNITTVTFIPETQLEAGSRDPASDSLSLISDIPLATDIDPDAPDGFWIEVTAAYEPINRGFQSMFFQTDLTAFLTAGHLLELGGLPFVITAATLTDDGTRTQIDISSFFPRGFAFGQDLAKVSVRPVYQPQPAQFLGRGGVVDTEETELILFGETDASGNLLPGRTLRPSIDYELNTDDGSIEFLNPPQGPLQPTQSLYLRHTQQRIIAPLQIGQFILNPRYDARFVYVQAPSEENGRLGEALIATYTFANPDSFFYRTIPLLDYLGEVSAEIAAEIAAQLPSLGPAPAVAPPVENATQGRLGTKSQARDLEDTDRAARVFLDFYNVSIVAFEQVAETISGNIVGDRDGKFQFFVGRDKEIPPPGYEDQISGQLNRRNLFSEVFFGYNPKATFMRRDPVVDPTNYLVDGDQLLGPYLDPDFFRDLQNLQREFSLNDVDDLVLFARSRKRLRLFPPRLEAFGRYRIMGQPSRFSRIFPERAEYFTLTDPGIGADLEADPIKPGVYAFRKRIQRLSIKGSGGSFKIQLPKRASTFFDPIADVGNPVLGQVENVGSVTVRNRLARARVFRYSATGFPEYDDLIIGVPNFTDDPRPAVIATPLPLHELPLDENGLPDVTLLAAQGGEIFDLTTGDPDLFTPEFKETDARKNFRPKVTFGRPDGRIIDVQTSDSLSFTFPSEAGGVGIGDPETHTLGKSVFVGEIILGCIITFAKEDNAPEERNIIKDQDDLLEVSEDPAAANPPIELFRGDTVFVTPSDAEVNPGVDPDEPVSNSQMSASLEGLPNFRVAFDVGIDRPDGELRDITAPSFDDPSIFGIKELIGQKPPKPLSNVEGTVTFRNALTEPAAIPALTGGFTNDSGDYSLPYLYAQNTEIDQLGIVQGVFNDLFVDSLIPNAVFPDEIEGVDGDILGLVANGEAPAILNTSVDTTPVATAGAYTPNTGIGDVAPFDILLVETNQDGNGLPAGSQGILSVGGTQSTVAGSTIAPPRFVTPTLLGDRIRYRLKTAMSFVNQSVLSQPPGMVVRRVGTVTQFDITQISTALLVFNDGTPAAVSGGLNNIFTLASDNVVTINIFTAPDLVNPAPVFLQSVIIDFGAGTITGDAGAPAITSVTADDNIIFADTPAPFVTIAPNPGLVPPTLPEDPLNPGETIPLWFTLDIDLTVGGAGNAGTSTTGFIDTDRVTFGEAYDLRSVLSRNEPAVAAVPVFSELSVAFITSGAVDDNTVNGDVEVNGGTPFTFLNRNEVYPFVGTFDPLPAGTGTGTLAVMSFEGHGNTPIVTSSPITFSAIPSSLFPAESVTPINQGTGLTGTTPAFDRDNRISASAGTPLSDPTGVGNVLPGDVVFITGSADVPQKGTTKAGSYLVKHAIEPNVLSTESRDLILQTKTLPANTQQGWANVQFPELVSADVGGSNEVVVSSTVLTTDTSISAWPAIGTLYFIAIVDSTFDYIPPPGKPDVVDYGTGNFKVDYTAVDNTTHTFTVDPASAESLDGTISGADALAAINALAEGTLLSGFFRFDVALDNVDKRLVGPPPFSPAPETLFRNTVGFNHFDAVDNPTGTTIGGFRHIDFTGPAGSFAFEFAPGPFFIVEGPPAVDEVGIVIATPIANTAFDPNEKAYVYNSVAQYVEIDQSVGNTYWDIIHESVAAGIFSPLPGDIFTTASAAIEGFQAQAGVFLEPSWPTPTLDLAGADERVVDAGHSVAAANIGFRDGPTFGEPPAATEPVSYEVRRIRRFHEVLSGIGELLGPLRYVYQIRRGTVTDFGPAPVSTEATVYPFVVTASEGTNLGPFNDELVNVNPGDTFRLFDDDGTTLLDEVEIGGIESGTQIWLKPPGITAISAGAVSGKPFEIYLRQIPVPHEQSNNQLFSLAADQIILQRTADYTTESGGFVPTEADPTDPRRLQDSDNTINYAALGVQEGDIVLIDSAGLVEGPGGVPSTGQERGTRPFGDRSVPNRTTATTGQEVPFIAGGPSELDDNRGWYRVTEVTSADVTVSSQTDFSNDPGGGFVTFGVEAEYAVLPTVSGSTAPFADPPGGPGVEGQLDLRPTGFAGTLGSPPDSYLGNQFSIAPFSYTIFRPNTLFSDDAIDLILLMRERTFSFLDEFDVFFREDKFGSYFVFQRDEHVADLGNPLIPDEGKGVMSNELVDGVRGLIAISPFANTSDSLSVLDRRFWVNDFRLDSEFPPGSPPGTPSYSTLESNANNASAEEGDGRPVLTDRIEDVLNDNDQLREIRFAWLDFRVNREDGILVQIRRFLDQLPKKRREELRQLRLQKSISDV
jgi:hypothetical protein